MFVFFKTNSMSYFVFFNTNIIHRFNTERQCRTSTENRGVTHDLRPLELRCNSPNDFKRIINSL